MTFDIMNPQVSKVSKSLEGKAILVYSSNGLGKTLQATRMPKPFYLGFEQGLRAISGIPFLPLNNWRDFKKINKQLTDPKNLEEVKKLYQTIIFDEVFASALYCQDYVCKKYGVETIGEGNGGYGLWSQYRDEYRGELDKLLKAGFTIVFIGHEEFSKEENKIVPKGDSRTMSYIRDNADIICRLISNGTDENGNVIKSSAWFVETNEFFARSRFDYMTPYIQEFTAENLEKAISEAIVKQEKEEGIAAVSYEEQKATLTSDELIYEDLMEEIKQVGNTLASQNKLEELNDLIEKHLGQGVRITECKKGQEQVMSVVLDEMKEMLDK